jgi:uncharacterized protein YndB with AHSA1/START domain
LCAPTTPAGDRVMAAWTRAELLQRWWAPKGFTTSFCTIDARVGGRFHYGMRSPEGTEICGLGIYRELSPDRIVYTDSFADRDGEAVPASYYGLREDYPRESTVIVTMDAAGGETTLTLMHSIDLPPAERAATEQGWRDMLERLADVLAK